MSQGLFAGGTDYQNQSLNDIIKDIEKWINYSQGIEVFLKEHIQRLKKQDIGLIIFHLISEHGAKK